MAAVSEVADSAAAEDSVEADSAVDFTAVVFTISTDLFGAGAIADPITAAAA